MEIAIIKYNAGNIQSVQYALQRLNVKVLVTDIPEEIKKADKVIFPGVGNAASAMEFLKERQLGKLIKDLKQPVLGICLGLQLLCNFSEEGETTCLGIFDTKVKRFKNGVGTEKSKVPQIGWNNLYEMKAPLFRGLAENQYVYFVHSYYAELCEETSAQSLYILPYSASLQKDNFYAVQFHTEKSGVIGEKILDNFLKL